MKKYVLLFVCSLTLLSCKEADNAFLGSGGSGGSGGSNPDLTTDFSDLLLLSDIPGQIGRQVGTGNQTLTMSARIFSSKDNSTIVYAGQGATDSDAYAYRAQTIGQTQIDQLETDPNFDTVAISGDGSMFVHVKNDSQIFAVVPSTQVTIEIGIGLTTPIYHVALPDDGSIVAFISDADLTGGNAGGFQQIFTLTTDGSESINQVTSFTANHFDVDSMQLAFVGNGSAILFHTRSDLTGLNTDASDEVFSISPGGGGLTQVSNINADGAITAIRSSLVGSFVAILLGNNVYVHDESQNIAVGFAPLNSTFAGDTSTVDGFSEDQFDISSDGSTLVYFHDTGDNFHQIYTASTNGSNVASRFVTNATIQSPRIAVDSTSVTFISNGSYGLSTTGNAYQVYSLAL